MWAYRDTKGIIPIRNSDFRRGGRSCRKAGQDNNSHIGWGGEPEGIGRLGLGYSQEIGTALEAMGMAPNDVPQVINRIGPFTLANLENSAMPTTDAIDLARFLAETTKQFVRFQPGSNSVGVNIDIATVTKHENFKWVDRKHFYSRSLNPLETDHA